MSSSNRATVGTGCASIQGLDWHITAAESVTISNGSQGMKRNDIICAHYHRDSKTGNELVELVVLKGSPNATAAADPTIPSGKILSGAVDAYMPLWRIPLERHHGRYAGAPVRVERGFVGFRNPAMPTAMAGYRIVRSVCLWRFEHHHGQRRSNFRGPVFVPKHRERRRLLCLDVQIGREALQSGRFGVRRECGWRRVWQTGEVER